MVGITKPNQTKTSHREITFLYRSVPDQLDRYPIATRPYTSGLGREQVAYKPDQAVVELGRAWSENLGDRDGRIDLIDSGNPPLISEVD